MLVEFPKVLLPGFSWTLKKLQELQSYDVAFARQLAPRTSEESRVFDVLPPAYASKENFAFDFSGLQRKNRSGSRSKSPPRLPLNARVPLSTLLTQREDFLDALGHDTTLDESQAAALCDSLSRELAFTQGPPGTGKTFLGVALAKTIVFSTRSPTQKPILAVCMTNHALDAFLGDLLKEGITRIARIGRGSREKWTEKYQLRRLSGEMRVPAQQLEKKRRCASRIRTLVKVLDGWRDSFNSKELGWYEVKDYLREKPEYRTVYNQLVTGVRTDAGLSEVSLARDAAGFTYSFWSKGGDIVRRALDLPLLPFGST